MMDNRNCGDTITNPNFKYQLYLSETESFEINVCPLKILPKDFSVFNTYVLMAEKYQFTPSDVDELSQRELMFFMAAIDGEGLAYKRKEKSREAMRKSREGLAKKTGKTPRRR